MHYNIFLYISNFVLIRIYSPYNLKQNALNNQNSIYTQTMPFKESKQFWRQPHNPPILIQTQNQNQDPQPCDRLLEHMVTNVPKGDIKTAVTQFDKFSEKNLMMSLGEEKANIIGKHVGGKSVKKILEVGGYCGYSSLMFAAMFPKAHIYSIQSNQKYAETATHLHKIVAASERITVMQGTVQSLEEQIRTEGPYDIILIDHDERAYLRDLRLLQSPKIMKKGGVIIADNIISAKKSDYLSYVMENANYDSVLEHTFVEYSDVPDGLLFSQRITEITTEGLTQ